MSLIGNFPEFGSFDNWICFSERLEPYFVLNNIEGDKRKAMLTATMSEEMYKILRTACHPMSPNSLTYEELVDKLNNEYLKLQASRVSSSYKRVIYYTAKQEETESIDDWKIRIKNLFSECEFPWKSEHELNEKFISGLYSTDILRKLCEEMNDNYFNFVRAVEIAKKEEKAVKEETTKIDGKE